MYAMSAAHPTLPDPELRAREGGEDGKEVIVRIKRSWSIPLRPRDRSFLCGR